MSLRYINARINFNDYCTKLCLVYYLLLRSLLPRLRMGTSTIIASDTSSSSTSVSLPSPCTVAVLSLAVLQLRLLWPSCLHHEFEQFVFFFRCLSCLRMRVVFRRPLFLEMRGRRQLGPSLRLRTITRCIEAWYVYWYVDKVNGSLNRVYRPSLRALVAY
jgi:hypothetical protein